MLPLSVEPRQLRSHFIETGLIDDGAGVCDRKSTGSARVTGTGDLHLLGDRHRLSHELQASEIEWLRHQGADLQKQQVTVGYFALEPPSSRNLLDSLGSSEPT